ncbi:MAG: Rossmann-like and DUF2520 domain-containing protein [Pelovirga sp.]
MSQGFALIGPGRVGAAIGKALYRQGWHPVSIIGRHLATTRDACDFIGCPSTLATTKISAAGKAGLILLAVPDDSIAATARQLQQLQIPTPGTVLLHFSGVHPAAVMRYPNSPTHLFSVHPLLPFADRQQAYEDLRRAPYIGEGDKEARPLAAELCTALGGQLQAILPHSKQLYHAAACLASNYFVTLIAEAASLLQDCGIEPGREEALLLPLLAATLQNVTVSGTGKGLTGPIVRGDIGTIKAHIEALSQNHRDLHDLYCLLGNRTALLAKRAGRLEPEEAESIQKLLNKKCFTNNDK